MTIPKPFRRVTDLALELLARKAPAITLSRGEIHLAEHLRGNEPLYQAICGILRERMAGRASVPEPTDPLVAKSMIARDREIQWLLGRLETVYKSPVNSGTDSEQPE